MKNLQILLSLLLLTTLCAAQPIDQYNVVWDAPSQNSSESMPCGGGDIGMNVWVENGDLLMYLSRSGAFDENNLFPKLGRVRVRLTPNPFTTSKEFRQELRLREGYIEITAGGTTTKVWVDVFRPVAHIETESREPVTAELFYETWRTKDHTWTTINEIKASRAFLAAPDSIKAVIRPDSIKFNSDRVEWYHRNRDRTLFDITAEDQGFSDFKERMWNPLKGLTFGGAIDGDGMRQSTVTQGSYADVPFTSWALKSEKPSRKHHMRVYLHIENTPTVADWQTGLNDIITTSRKAEKTAHADTKRWWSEFWNRSYIAINPTNPDPQSKAWQVGRNYQLFRYQLGCNAFGRYPTKFNGGFFTYDPVFVDSSYHGITPDHRNWGGGTHTAQNQRLVYWPMLKSGDFDMMRPQLDFYLNMLPTAELRSKIYWGHGGACFPEQPEQFGLPVTFEYGWSHRRPAGFPAGVDHNRWLEYTWDTVLEFCLMALDAQQYAGVDISRYIPLVESSLEFFFQHYEYQARLRSAGVYDDAGKLVIYPGSAAETYKVAYNPVTTVAGLQTVISRMLELPDQYLDPAKRDYWKKRLSQVPTIPFRERNGLKTIAPAETYARINNAEIPQLYPVFPFGIYGVGKPDLDVAVNTWRYGLDVPGQRDFRSWHQDVIFCARLGLTDEAEQEIIKKMEDAPRRYPTWWGPGNDWVPDHNWGGVGMIGLQEMLMQTDGRRILLFPAWPKDWNVSFRLHAPHGTIVEGELRDGKPINVKTTPENRIRDVEIMLK